MTELVGRIAIPAMVRDVKLENRWIGGIKGNIDHDVNLRIM